MKIISVLWILLFTTPVVGQSIREKREKYPTIFAVQARGILSTNFISPKTVSLIGDSVFSDLTHANGRAFGGVLRKTFSERFALESGLHFSNRRFRVNMSYPDSNLLDSNRFRYVNYEIPLTALVFVKLSPDWYANAGLGFTMTYGVSDAGVKTYPRPQHEFDHRAVLLRKFGLDVNAQFGFEYRTRKQGTFYLGGAARIGLTPMFTFFAGYSNDYSDFSSIQFKDVQSGYLSVDLRYYFPIIKNKGQQPIEGPINQ